MEGGAFKPGEYVRVLIKYFAFLKIFSTAKSFIEYALYGWPLDSYKTVYLLDGSYNKMIAY